MLVGRRGTRRATKNGKSDVHESTPDDFKKRMLAKKKKDCGYSSGSSCNGAVPKAEEPYSQFQNEGTCGFGGKCKFSHGGVARGGNNDQSSKKLSSYQKNDVKVLVASAVKKALRNIAKKRKPDEISEDDTDLEAIIASCLPLVG